MALPITLALIYLLGMPLLVRLACVAHKQVFITRKMQKMPRSKAASANLPKPLWPRIKEHMRFALSDKRPLTLKKPKEGEPPKEGGLTNKQAVLGLWLLGLAATVGLPMAGLVKFVALGPVLFLLALTLGMVKAHPVLLAREQLYRKMFEIGKGTLGISAEHAENPQAVVQVLEWRDLLAPSKVRFQVPTTFNADSEENFQRQFNQVFGTETTWVPFNDPETGKPGWDYAEGLVTLREMPPLPTMAPWDEHYVLDQHVAWSFFPIGLGVENGIEVPNPKTGEMENVLGFDVSGEQAGLSKKLGTYCSPTVVTSPMVLIGGGTGGGKALAIDTMVRRVTRESAGVDEDLR